MRKYLLLTFICYVLALNQVFAQERSVSGKVTSKEDGSALPGVNVVIKGTTIGTVTDVDGLYRISILQNDATLQYSFIGLSTMEVEVGNKEVIDVQLQADIHQLGEVVVTAAGIERQVKGLGYSVENIEGEKLSQKSEPDVLRSLQGKIPGVNILSTSGAPGSSTRITIRGNKSFFGNNQPLFIVDGIPFDNSYSATSNDLLNGAAYSSRLADLDPNNIASMNVLKGGAAAALYGVRASNGVVVITTKSGSSRASKKGLEITYASSLSFEKIANLPDYQNKYGNGSKGDYAEANGSWGPAFNHSGPAVSYHTDGTVTPNTSGVDSIDYWKAYAGVFPNNPKQVPYRAYPNNVKDFFNTGVVLENSISVTGGNDKSVLSLVASRLKQNGYIPNSEFGRTNISLGGTTHLDNGLIIGGNLSYINTIQRGPLSGNGDATIASSSAFSRILYPGRNWDIQGQPYENPSTKGQVFFLGSTADNPYWSTKNNGIRSNVDRIIANVNANYDLRDWLNVSYRIGINSYTDRRKEVTRKGSVGSNLGQIILDDYYFQEIESTLLLTVNKNITPDITFKAIAGHNINQRTYDQQSIKGVGAIAFDIDDIDNYNNVTRNGGDYQRRRLYGVFGDVTFGYKDYLFLSATGRNDWSSTLPVSKRSFFYPSVSSSFVFSEAFGVPSEILSSGKIRAAWSKVGNDAPVYSLYPTYNLNFGASSGAVGSLPDNDLPFRGQAGATKGITVYDPNLTPEFTREIELGTDLQFFNNRAGIQFTWYDKLSTNQIAPIALPDETGFNQYITNFGAISNRGVEIGLQVTPVKLNNGFSWDVMATYTRNKNEVVSLVAGVNEIIMRNLYGGQVTPVLQAGQPYGILKGTYNVRDDAGNLLIDPATGLAIQSNDFKVIGNPNPNFIASLSNTFKFKGLALSFLFNYRDGGSLYSNTNQFYLGRGVTRDTENREGYFVVPGVYGNTNTLTPILKDGKEIPNTTQVILNDVYFQTAGGSFGINGADEVSIFDATVIRLSEVTLGYTVPKSLLTKTPFGAISLILTGRNLWYNAPNFPKHSNFDPETSTFGAQNYTGIEYTSAPSVKRYGINLRVTF